MEQGINAKERIIFSHTWQETKHTKCTQLQPPPGRTRTVCCSCPAVNGRNRPYNTKHLACHSSESKTLSGKILQLILNQYSFLCWESRGERRPENSNMGTELCLGEARRCDWHRTKTSWCYIKKISLHHFSYHINILSPLIISLGVQFLCSKRWENIQGVLSVHNLTQLKFCSKRWNVILSFIKMARVFFPLL